jgi:predicted MFS family arabinose efflux permease
MTAEFTTKTVARRQEPGALALALAGLVSLAIAMGVGRFAFTPLLPMMQADAGLALTQGGWLASANYLGYLLGALGATFLAISAVNLYRWGLIAVVVTTALMGLTSSWLPWLAWRFVAGIASAWVLVGTSAQCLGRLAALKQPGKAGIVFAGVGIGMAIAGLLCMGLGLAQVSSSSTWLVLAGLSALAMLATLPLWRPLETSAGSSSASTGSARQPTQVSQNNNGKPARTLGQYTGLILCYGLFGFGYILPATFVPAQARQLVSDPAVFGLAWPVFGAAAAVSTLVASKLAVRFKRSHLWAACQLIMAAGVVLPAIYPSMVSIVAAAVCVGGTFMVITMVGMQEAQAAGGALGRRLIGAFSAAFAAGQLAGPVVFSLTHDAFGVSLESSLMLACAALLASTVFLMKLSSNRKNTT